MDQQGSDQLIRQRHGDVYNARAVGELAGAGDEDETTQTVRESCDFSESWAMNPRNRHRHRTQATIIKNGAGVACKTQGFNRLTMRRLEAAWRGEKGHRWLAFHQS